MTVKGPSRLRTLLRGREKVLLGLLAAVIVFVLAIVVPVSLKAKSSRRSATAAVNVAASSDTTSMDQEEAIISTNPTGAPISGLWNLPE